MSIYDEKSGLEMAAMLDDQEGELDRIQSIAAELAAALRESLKVHDKYLARSKANAFYFSEFKPENSPTAGEARIREQARVALAKYDEVKSC